MTRTFVILLVLTMVAWSSSESLAQEKQKTLGQQQQQEMSPESLKQKASYLIGYNTVKNLQAQQIDFDMQEFLKGIKDAADGKTPPMTDEEIRSVQLAFERMVTRQQQERMAKVADENMRKGTEFLKANLLKEGVKEMENGLQYQVLAKGEGESPRITDSVKLNYKAMFIDGTVFETTSGTEPLSITVGGAGIRGIVNALQKMKPGSKWKLFIPSDLAFGVQGDPGGIIGPNRVLIYELELLEIMK